MSVVPSVLKRSVLRSLGGVPTDKLHPQFDFAGSFTTIVDERFNSLDARKLPKYDEDVLKSFEKGINNITSNKWKNKVSPGCTPLDSVPAVGSSSHSLPPAHLLPSQYPPGPSVLIPSSDPIMNYRRLDSFDQIIQLKMKPWWRNFFELEAEGFEDRMNSGELDQRVGLPRRTPGMTTWELRQAVENGQL